MKPYTPILSADLVEHEAAYQVHVDLPGVDKSLLDVSFHDGLMTIQAERKEVVTSNDSNNDNNDKNAGSASEQENKNNEKNEKKKLTVHKIERSYGKVQRSIRLPKDADTSRAEASLKDGVLLVSIPKNEQSQVHKLTIQ